MPFNVEEEVVWPSLDGISHELLIRRCDQDDGAGAASTQQSVMTASHGDAALNLAQGENWLRLLASLRNNSVLQDTQETAIGTVPFPSVSSLSEIGTIDAPTEDCYICIDVDGPYVSIKDMRAPLSSQESEDDVFDVCIKRRKQRHEKIAELADSQETGIGEEYHALEALERRQLRMLHQGDCIVVRNNSVGSGSDLVLEYHQYKADESRANGEEMTDESQVVDDTGIAAASGGTETSKPSDRPQTQPDPTPRLSDYQTAVESQPAPESEEETSETSSELDEAEATQVFARSTTVLSTQSPEKQRDSDDEMAMDVDVNEREQTFMTPAGRESELVARSTGGLAAEFENKMELSTQSLSSRNGTDEENGEQMGGNRMSPIAEESAKTSPENAEAEATPKSSSADDDKLDAPRSQASTTLDDTQRAEGSDDDDVTENREGGDVGGDSDALLDDEDIKDASIDVPKTPNKVDSVSKTDLATEKMAEAGKDPPSKEKGGLACDERGIGRPKATVGDETSDSSSITEVDEEISKPKLKESISATTNESQHEVAETAGVPASSALYDDDITEPGDLISPRKGLESVPARGKSGDNESSSPEQSEAKEVEPGSLTETTVSDTLKQPQKEEKVAKAAGLNEIAAKPAVERIARKVIEWDSREDNDVPASAETNEGKSSSDSSPPKECLSHTEETEVANNMSSRLNRESPAEKEVIMAEDPAPEPKEAEETADEQPRPEEAPTQSNAIEMEAVTTDDAGEVAKDTKQTDSLDTPVDQKAIVDEPCARDESDHAENNNETQKEEFPDDRVSSNVDNGEVAEREPSSRPTRASRKKAPPAQEDGDDKEEDEDAVRPPAKKRARLTSTKAKSEIEKKPERDELLNTPAKKSATREAGHGLRASARKRTRGARTPTSGDDPVRVLMTGVAEGTKEKKVREKTKQHTYHFGLIVFHSFHRSCLL